MAVKKRKKKRFAIRFELGIGGVLGLSVVCFCVFLWMFLLGVWSGQTVLLPSAPGEKSDAFNRLAANIWQQGKNGFKENMDAGLSSIAETVAGNGGQEEAETPSRFSLQVASFRDKENAHRAVLGWQARGQDAFYLPPDDESSYYRVFVGKFDTLTDANALAASLESDENVRAYVTLLPADAVGE